MSAEAETRSRRAWLALQAVPDPELPMLSVCDLGLVREVNLGEGTIEVVLTPTYSGCPATEVIARSVHDALVQAGLGTVTVSTRRAPAWSTDWISAEGRDKLHRHGIVPPSGAAPAGEGGVPIRIRSRSPALECPRCASLETERLSAFGSTACKALYRCRACHEPFEHFKPL
jgi:ring-1,2-phenylacetyl-CoA epoxidase subunit PaaD